MSSRILRSTGLVVIAVCALALSALAGDKDPVARPFKVKVDFAFVVNLDEANRGEAVGVGQGEGTHVGKFEVQFAGSFDIEASEFVGEGILTAANGDLIYFKMTSLDGVRIIGGTGRFENATGGHTIEPIALPEQKLVDGQLIVTFGYTGQGTITYAGRPHHPYKRHFMDKRRS